MLFNLIKCSRVFVFLLSPFLSFSQNTEKALHKGDTIPAHLARIYEKGNVKNISLRDYKGKILLLDFWSTTCADCLASMPEMLSLQDQFKDQIKILLVTRNTPGQIEDLWKRFENRPLARNWVNAGKQLPFIIEDSVLVDLFPHQGAPTHVWIDKSQIFRSIAYPESTTAENIYAMLRGKEILFAEKRFLDIDEHHPLTFLNIASNDKQPISYYSFFTNYIGSRLTSMPVILTDSSTKNPVGISCVNMSILDLYRSAYHSWFAPSPIPDNRILLEVKFDTNRFRLPQKREGRRRWISSNYFCYARRMPQTTVKQILQYMKADLDQFFRLHSRIETRKVKCLVLSKNAGNSFKSLQTQPNESVRNDQFLILKNMPMDQLISNLKRISKSHFGNIPVLNKTGYEGSINIQLPWKNDISSLDLKTLLKALNSYGLELKQEVQELEMLVIEDSKEL